MESWKSACYTTARELESKFGGEEFLEMKRRFFRSYAILYAKYSSIDGKLELVEKDVLSGPRAQGLPLVT